MRTTVIIRQWQCEVRRLGDRAVLVQPPSTADVLALAQWLRAALPGAADVIPGAATVAVRHDSVDPLPLLQSAATEVEPEVPAPSLGYGGTAVIEVPVRYDGPDLSEVARLCGTSVQSYVDQHTEWSFTALFHGFAPGFAYLGEVAEHLRVPRLAAPRVRVPAGAVAVADRYCGIYPRASPGGWRIIGHTTLTVFDERRDPAALIAPGTSVRFVPDS